MKLHLSVLFFFFFLSLPPPPSGVDLHFGAYYLGPKCILVPRDQSQTLGCQTSYFPVTSSSLSEFNLIRHWRRTRLQSGPKVLDHWGIINSDFPRSPFWMLIHTVLAQTPLLSKHWDGKGELHFDTRFGQRFHLMINKKLNFSAVNGWKELKYEAVQRRLVLIVGICASRYPSRVVGFFSISN